VPTTNTLRVRDRCARLVETVPSIFPAVCCAASGDATSADRDSGTENEESSDDNPHTMHHGCVLQLR